MRFFAYRLALQMGEPNVDRMLRGMSGVQLQEWMAFDKLYTLADTRQEYLTASIVQALINVNTSSKSKRVKLEDVKLQFVREEEKPKKMDAKKMDVVLKEVLGAL